MSLIAVPQNAKHGFRIHRGDDSCDCPVRILGQARCEWCGGIRPSLTELDREMMRECEAARNNTDTTDAADAVVPPVASRRGA